MELNIIQENQNPLFNRKEIKGTIKDKSIPSKIDVAKTLAEKYSVPMEAIRVLDIQGQFGISEFKLRANVYTSKEERDKMETMSKKEKETEAKAVEAAKAEEAPVEAETKPKEEAPAEPVTEEAPKETEAPVEEKKEEAKE